MAESGEAEVDDLDHICVVFYEHIVKLDIPVCNAPGMQIVEGFRDLLEEAATDALFYLSVRALLLDVLVQRYAFDVVGYQTDLLAGFNDVVHSNNVRMIDFLER